MTKDDEDYEIFISTFFMTQSRIGMNRKKFHSCRASSLTINQSSEIEKKEIY